MNHDTLLAVYNLKFESNDLDTEVSIGEWLKTLLKTVLYEQEGFSGKRPFGNSSWMLDVEYALVKAGFVQGTIDPVDGDLTDIDSDGVMKILNAVVDAFIV
jgi:hypothetical protein